MAPVGTSTDSPRSAVIGPYVLVMLRKRNSIAFPERGESDKGNTLAATGHFKPAAIFYPESSGLVTVGVWCS